MSAGRDTDTQPGFRVREVRTTSEHWAAYRLRYEWPAHDADDRRLFAFHARRVVMDPWDVRHSRTYVAWRGADAAGTLRLVLRRRTAYLRRERGAWVALALHLDRDITAVIRASGILSRAAVVPSGEGRGRALIALLRTVERTARDKGLEVLIARSRERDVAGRATLARLGYRFLRPGLCFKVLCEPEAARYTNSGGPAPTSTTAPATRTRVARI